MSEKPLGITGLQRKSSEKTSCTLMAQYTEAMEWGEGKEIFTSLCKRLAKWTGSYKAVALAMLLAAVWLVSGPLFRFSNTWQLVLNIATTMVTFLMVFLIQHTQNRGSEAMQLKLDALLLTSPYLKNMLGDFKALSQEDLEELKARLTSVLEDNWERRSQLNGGDLLTASGGEVGSLGEPIAGTPGEMIPTSPATN